jgi:tensin
LAILYIILGFVHKFRPKLIHNIDSQVKDSHKFWYKPHISREEAIALLRHRPAGTFVVRDSNSFPGAFGLALKVATPPVINSR